MKIYTYYHKLNDKYDHSEMVDLWKLSWERKGFEAIVLNQKDALTHPFYDEFTTRIKKLSKGIAGKDTSKYGMSCWERWLAYANQKNADKFFVSDYDMINYNFNPKTPPSNLSFYDEFCPCLASGNSKQFLKLCYNFIKLTKDNFDFLQKQTNHFHDQEFFIYNGRKLQEIDNVTFTRSRPAIGEFFRGEINEKVQIYHIAHANTDFLRKKIGGFWKGMKDDQEIRMHVIKKILKI